MRPIILLGCFAACLLWMPAHADDPAPTTQPEAKAATAPATATPKVTPAPAPTKPAVKPAIKPIASKPTLKPKVTATPAKKVAAKAEPKAADLVKAVEGAKASTATAKVPPAPDPNYPKEVPDDVGGAISKGGDLLIDAKAKKWFAFSAGIIWLIMFLFKWGRKTFEFMQAIPKRAMWVIVPVLSMIGMFLAHFQGNVSWEAAITIATSGPFVAYLNDFLKRGVMGKEPASTIRGPALKIPEWAKDEEEPEGAPKKPA